MDLRRIVVTVMSGADDGKVYELNKVPIVLGRRPENDVFLPYDTRVSRDHAIIGEEDVTYYIEDVGPDKKGSRNGTYVRNERIRDKTRISKGEMILLGHVWVRFDSMDV